MDPIKVNVVIPCYNEEQTLPALFEKLDKVCNLLIDKEKYNLEIILVNDGSSDNTLKLLNKQYSDNDRVKIINRDKNGGFGAAIKSGLEAVTGDITVTIDADTNYDQLEIPKILDLLTEGIDIVTASPLHPDGKWNFPAHRFMTSRGVAQLYKMSLGKSSQGIYTYTSGFRVYRSKILPEIMPDANDFLATAELLINALLKGYKVKEYPTVVYDRIYGTSKLNTVKTAISHIKFIFKIYFGIKK